MDPGENPDELRRAISLRMRFLSMLIVTSKFLLSRVVHYLIQWKKNWTVTSRYLSKGAEWIQSREGCIPGLAAPAAPSDPKKADDGPSSTEGLSKSAKKNLKRKEKKKQEKEATAQVEAAKVTEAMLKMDFKEAPATEASNSQPANGPSDTLKKLRNLKKKVKQIEELEAKIKSGELKNPEKEQLAKLSKKQSVLQQIEELELDLKDS